MLVELHDKQEHPTNIKCDNQPTITLSMNLGFHEKCKHINIKYHFIIDLVKDCEIVQEYYKSKEQVDDILSFFFGPIYIVIEDQYFP